MTDLDLPDVNVLIALLHPDHVHHRAAHAWFATVNRFATTPITESGFLRLALNPRITGDSVSASVAIASLQSLRAHPRAEFLPDATSLADPLIDVVALVGFRQVTDLHLVNLAAQHTARLVTFDAKISPTLAAADQDLVHTLG